MTTMWLLIIHMVNGNVTHGHFIDKANCELVGKSIVGKSKNLKYECRVKRVKLK